jgi:8-oxo-dGTP pyrophosphatase MutT (NUDIX family)
VAALAPSPHWLAHLHSRAQREPQRPRAPLRWMGLPLGSAEPPVLRALALRELRETGEGFEVVGALTPALAAVAFALRSRGFVRAWRDEQLAVHAPDGTVLGTVERGVVRLLGIATHAVHLLGFDAEGRHWVQQRAFDKPDDPGLWDTLMGGMVGAGESTEQTLERETWEEAGLKLAQLQHLERGGLVITNRPSANVPHGYVVEALTWYRCVLPDGVSPRNVDGEVEQFRCMTPHEVVQRLEADQFTIDAGLMLVQA